MPRSFQRWATFDDSRPGEIRNLRLLLKKELDGNLLSCMPQLRNDPRFTHPNQTQDVDSWSPQGWPYLHLYQGIPIKETRKPFICHDDSPGGFFIQDKPFRSWNCVFTKNFRYLKWRNPEPYFRLFWGWGFPYISRIHTAYIGVSYLHFRYLKCLVMFGTSFFPLFPYTSSSRASRGRKFQKKKELYSKESICL